MNWCPGLGTVLANEEVTADGRSEIGNFPVFKRNLQQWMMRITAYADRLIADLDRLDWPEPIKMMQRNWIGRSEGASIDFPVDGDERARSGSSPPGPTRCSAPPTWCWRPSTRWSTPSPPRPGPSGELPARGPAARRRRARPSPPTAARSAPRSEVERQVESREKTGVFIGAYCVNPVTGERHPGVRRRLRADGLRHRRHHGRARPGPARLGLRRRLRPADHPHGAAAGGLRRRGLRRRGPGHQQRLPRRPGRRRRPSGPSSTGWRPTATARAPSPTSCATGCSPASATGASRSRSSTTRPACRSRLPDSELPVELPEVDDYSPRTFDPDDETSQPVPPLARADEWLSVELDLGDGPRRYVREANVMPQWAGSCWYELRYLDPTNENAFVDPAVERYWMGPSGRRRRGRRRPLRRRRRARRAAPAVRPLLAQGAVRPRLGVVRGALPPPVQPGLHPGLRLHRRPGHVRARRGGPRRAAASGPGTASRSTASTGRWARA